MCVPKRYSYRLEIQRAADGAKFPVGRIADAFLQSARDQAIFLAQRRGIADADEDHVRESPVLMATNDDGQISQVKICVGEDGHSQSVQLEFGLELFAPAASMEAQQLARQGHLRTDEKFLYRVFAEPPEVFAEPPETHQASVAMAGVVARVRRSPLPLLDGQLSDLLSRGDAVGSCETSDYPLFVTRRALDTAREYCRKPVDKEAGALLLGHLYRQQKPEPEIFGIIDDAIEAKHAEQTLFRLDLTTDGFAYLRTQLRLRKSRLGRRTSWHSVSPMPTISYPPSSTTDRRSAPIVPNAPPASSLPPSTARRMCGFTRRCSAGHPTPSDWSGDSRQDLKMTCASSAWTAVGRGNADTICFTTRLNNKSCWGGHLMPLDKKRKSPVPDELLEGLKASGMDRLLENLQIAHAPAAHTAPTISSTSSTKKVWTPARWSCG